MTNLPLTSVSVGISSSRVETYVGTPVRWTRTSSARGLVESARRTLLMLGAISTTFVCPNSLIAASTVAPVRAAVVLKLVRT